MAKFVKVSELSGEDRSKVREYWAELWGAEYAKALVTDYKPEGEQKEVAASSKKKVK